MQENITLPGREKYRKPAMFIFSCLVFLGLMLSISYRVYGPPQIQITHRPRLNTEALESLLKPGDLVFQTTVSAQSGPIARATHSPLTHVGIVFQEKGKWLVLEAVQPVKITPFAQFKSVGKEGAICIRRPQAEFDVNKVIEAGKQWLDGPYDYLFGWGDDKMYCSELVYKAFEKGASLKLGDLQAVETLDFSSLAVQELMIHRLNLDFGVSERYQYHSNLMHYKTFLAWRNSQDWKPELFSEDTLNYLKSPILTPISQFRSKLLTTVYCEYQID
ncbi:MAG: hypothetical protein H3C47_06065 [Candidatus Cloacimonetes bacterium]|nr:hypothetical protein [Candidatus Cloacimonadota bacterium]